MGSIVKVKVNSPAYSNISNYSLISLVAGGFQLGLLLSFTPTKQDLISNLPSLFEADFSAIPSKYYNIILS